MVTLLKKANSADNILRYLVALGNLAVGSTDICKPMIIAGLL